MSRQEEQQLLLRHTRPREDAVTVPGTGRDSLDPALVTTFLAMVRRTSTALARADDDSILLNMNVITENGSLTRAGLYALGTYPQRFLPALSITAAYLPRKDEDDEGTVRATNRLDLTGPLPQMLGDAVEWVTRTAETRIRFGQDGHGRDETEYPTLAVRELVANALVHRDLSEPALAKKVELRLTPDRLIVTNPGGLYGLSVDQLGTRNGKSQVNEHLYHICTSLQTPDGRRVIEGLGTGIGAAQRALAEAGMESVRFQDTDVRFTALVPRAALLAPADLTWLHGLGFTDLSVAQRHALAEMRHGRVWSSSTYRKRFTVDSQRTRADLRELVAHGLVVTTGERGTTE